MFDLLSEIKQTISNNKLRTALTGFAVAWGIMMMIVLLGFANSVILSFEDFYNGRDKNALTVWRGYTSKPYQGFNSGRFIKFTPMTISRLNDSGDPYIRSARSQIYIDTATVAGPHDYVAIALQGVAPEEARRERIKIIAGRSINKSDMDDNRKSIVLSKKTVQQIFNTENYDSIIGKRVRSMNLSWLVVGVYERDWGRDNAYVPFNTVAALSGGTVEIWQLRLLVNNIHDEESAKEAENSILADIAKIHNFDPTDRAAVGMWNEFTEYFQSKKGMTTLNLAIWILGLLTILSGIVGVSNIMFVSVRERKHEIGIRRAIGAKRRHILVQIILEGVAITLIFGYIGMVLGTITTELISSMMSNMDGNNPLTNPRIDINIALQMTAMLVVAGAFAALFPALKATKVEPVEALRDE